MPRPIPDIIPRWYSTWSSLDPDSIAALYCEDGKHASAYANEYMSLGNSVLKSRAAIRLYAESAAKRIKSIEAELINVISDYDETGGHAAIEYWRTVNGKYENRLRIVEILEWRGDEITSCRVFHF